MRRDDEQLADISETAEKTFVRTAKGRQACRHILVTKPLPPTVTDKVCERDHIGAVTRDDDSLACSGKEDTMGPDGVGFGRVALQL